MTTGDHFGSGGRPPPEPRSDPGGSGLYWSQSTVPLNALARPSIGANAPVHATVGSSAPVHATVGSHAPTGYRARRRVRAGVLVGFATALVAGVATVAATGLGGGSSGASARGALPPATAQVTRMTLSDTENVDGTLGYGDPTTVSAHATGTLTWLPAVGDTVERGKALYRVDDHPVVLLYGSLPVYRTLANGVNGPDVKQFEQNLAVLGYHGFTVDDDFDANTASAVQKWQHDLGVDETGRIDARAVAYAAAAVRITDQKGRVGDPATGPILTYTGTTRAVTIALDVSKQQLVKVGVAATVALPDNKTVAGTVTQVGTVAHAHSPPPGGGSSNATIDVTVSITDQKALGSYDEAPVQVGFVSDQRKDVLTVPIAALLALAEGGYGVQVVEGSVTHIVAVQVGLFANGRVEISGDGIAPGVTVGVPR